MIRLLSALLVLSVFPSTNVQAQDPHDQETLQVGVRVAPPFVIPDGAGGYDGLAIRLWEALAGEMQVDYVYRERGIQAILEETASGELDVAVGALTITAERERRLDFTHSWFRTGLGVAASLRHDSGWWAVVRVFFSRDFMMVLLALVALLTFWGMLLWLAERRRNKAQFSQRPLRGIGSGFWWAAVTMTTVGYGDKAPVTFFGRLIGLIWMFAALVTVSTFTALITSSLTVGQLESRVSSPSDLRRAHVAALPGTTAAEWLNGRQIDFTAYEALTDALQALERGEVEAVVSDEALLRYQISAWEMHSLHVLPFILDEQDYGFAVIEAGELREPINRALLVVTASEEWEEWQREFLGD
ncbi:transporter substrate-binding domain-containing protein [Thioalkalivibrio sp.]|uniref:transporter substrate-binding domain-containing protein n=1 Tax=Thioalkalivibrio sp. TaxID=2093813 RepID=UPI003562D173